MVTEPDLTPSTGLSSNYDPTARSPVRPAAPTANIPHHLPLTRSTGENPRQYNSSEDLNQLHDLPTGKSVSPRAQDPRVSPGVSGSPDAQFFEPPDDLNSTNPPPSNEFSGNITQKQRSGIETGQLVSIDSGVLANIMKSLAVMENKILKLDTLDTLESINISLRSDISKMKSTMEDLTGQVSHFTEELSKLDNKWEKHTTELVTKMSKLEANCSKNRADWEACKGTLKGDISLAQSDIAQNSSKIRALESQIAATKEGMVGISELAERLSQLESQLSLQKEKLDSLDKLEDKIKGATENKFQDLKGAIKKEVRAEVIHEFRINQKAANAEIKYDRPKDLVFIKRQNLIICGLAETFSEEADLQAVKDLFKDRLGLMNLDIDDVYRLGTHLEGNPNARPLVVRFTRVKDHWKVWKKRGLINSNNTNPTWIQQDLPKQLREDLRVLQRIAKMARLQPAKYGSPRVRDFMLQLNGKGYDTTNIRQLPADLHPEVVYMPRSDSTVVFFTKQSPLSNHHSSRFHLGGHFILLCGTEPGVSQGQDSGRRTASHPGV